MSQKKAYCFTLNNYTDEEYESFKRVLGSACRYACIGRETGENGTPHLQGYCVFTKPYRFNTIKARYLPRCHIEVSAGSPDANRRYCTKDGVYWEHGTCPSNTGYRVGKSDQKSNRRAVAESFSAHMARGRTGLDEFFIEFPEQWLFSGHNLLRNFLAVQRPVERPAVTVRWFYGNPGTGKSRKAHEELPEAYVKEPKTKWWNGYLCEPDVIIDDYGLQCVDINHLLRWFDRYKCYVENKGGMLPLCASNFIITSNFHPSQLFKTSVCRFESNVSTMVEDHHPQLPALMRRITLEEFNYIIFPNKSLDIANSRERYPTVIWPCAKHRPSTGRRRWDGGRGPGLGISPKTI